jgi:hypothetical protein
VGFEPTTSAHSIILFPSAVDENIRQHFYL